MLFAMCADMSMLIGFLFFMLIAGFVLVGLFVLALIGVMKLIDAWRGPETISLFPQNVP